MQEMASILKIYFIPAAIAVCFVVGIVANSITQMVKAIARERSRREIAAYIAEGSMTPEQGERLMQADQRKA